MTALVTENLASLASAPNGIRKVRGLVLDLAVRGKLSQQKGEDGCASDLIVQIEHARSSLIGRGLLKAQKELPEIAADDAPFRIPSNWAWARLGSITNFGTTDKRGAIEAGSWILDLEDIEKETSRLLRKVRFAERQSLSDKNGFSAGDVLYGKLRPYLNKVIVADEPGFCTTEILPFRCHGPWHAGYFKIALQSPCFLGYVNGKSYGMKMPRLGTEDGRMAVLPLPPLPEQHRIVAKVDELMALCDRLEAEQADAEAAHAKLVEALLASLTQARDAADFRASWQQLAEHFHTLFTSEASVDALKQVVLQLAIQGKLVPQCWRYEAATEFLKSRGIDADVHVLPGWATVTLGNLGAVLGGATPSKANAAFWLGDIPWVSPKDMKRALIADAEDHVSPEAVAGSALKLIPRGSILMVVRGMILAHSFPVALTEAAVTINQDMKALVPPSELARYLLLFLQASKHDMVALVDRSSHGTCKLVSDKLWSYAVTLPPVAEQARIVAKVEALLGLCDVLKRELAAARECHARVAAVLVEHAEAAT